MTARLRIVVLISGTGTNLQSLIDYVNTADVPAELVGCISNRDAAGLARARTAGIPAQIVLPGDYADRDQYDQALQDAVDLFRPGLVVLAGYMLILGAQFVEHFRGRLLNIHPSLLPKYKGLDTHARALAAGDAMHGATVHFVTEELDGGAGLIQAVVPVRPGDDTRVLSARVQSAEHKIYPMAVEWIARGRVDYSSGRVYLDQKPLTKPVRIEWNLEQTVK